MENIMKPEDVDSQLISQSLAQVRPAPDDLDDETLALIIDQGMDAVPHEQRSEMLRIIGTNPENGSTLNEFSLTARIVDGESKTTLVVKSVPIEKRN